MDVHWSWTHNIYGLIWQQEQIGGIHIKCEFDAKTEIGRGLEGKKSSKTKKRKSGQNCGKQQNCRKFPGCSCSVPIVSNGFLPGFPQDNEMVVIRKMRNAEQLPFSKDCRLSLRSSEPWKILGCLSVPVTPWFIPLHHSYF